MIHLLLLSLPQTDNHLYIVEVTKRIKTMAYIATALAIIAVASTGYIGGWLVANQDEIKQKLSTKVTEREATMLRNTNRTMAAKLKSLGWQWKSGSWQQIGDTRSRGSK